MASVVDRLREFHEDVSGCTRCRDIDLVHRNEDGRWAYPVLQRGPTGRAGVLFVAEAPNWADTFDPDKGRLTVEADTDPTGAFFRELLEHAGLAVDDIIVTNAVLCLPKERDGRHPVGSQLREACLPWLVRLILAARPRVVVTLGGKALEALDRIERHGLALKTAAGRRHRWFGRALLPLYHPGRLGRIARPAAQQRSDIAVLRGLLAPAVSPAGADDSGVREQADERAGAPHRARDSARVPRMTASDVIARYDGFPIAKHGEKDHRSGLFCVAAAAAHLGTLPNDGEGVARLLARVDPAVSRPLANRPLGDRRIRRLADAADLRVWRPYNDLDETLGWHGPRGSAWMALVRFRFDEPGSHLPPYVGLHYVVVLEAVADGVVIADPHPWRPPVYAIPRVEFDGAWMAAQGAKWAVCLYRARM